MRQFLLFLAACLAWTSWATWAGAQETDNRASVLVLDASGSMWAQLPEGRSRIEVARDVLDDFLGARPAAVPLGVIAYGHNRKGDCSDITVIAPVEAQDGSALGAQLRALSPRGKTPIADALRLAASQIPRTAEDVDIVLITDGLETCGGDPCAVAVELAQSGVPLRAHVVGFGLTEDEIRQIACVAEETGGLVLATQSGAELADALIRTTTPAPAAPPPPGTASINLTIRADIARRPDKVTLRGVSKTTNESREFGILDFALANHLTVELAADDWLLSADGGEQGNGELEVTISAGDNTTIYIPFRGLLPSIDMPAPAGAFRAGINGLIPYRVTQEGLATGGGDFVFSLLPVDAVDTDDRRMDYATQNSSLGADIGVFRAPAEPGQYLLVFHRNARMPVDEVMKSFVITVENRPEVRLSAPPSVAPGAPVAVTVTAGLGNSDRIEIWRDGALYSWDQSVYLQEFYDNRYGPAKPLLAPAEPGAYEIVYLFSELYDEEAIAARLPLTVEEAPVFEEDAALGTSGAPVRQADAGRCDDDTGCGMGEDAPQAGSGVTQVIIAAEGAEGQAVDWTLVPIGRPDELPVASGGAVAGPWSTTLDVGTWGVNGIADGVTFFAEITVQEGVSPYFPIARVSPEALTPVAAAVNALACAEQFQCVFDDTEAQIIGGIPAGWVRDTATREGYVAGGTRGLVRMSFFHPDYPQDSIVLNPRQWIAQNGPCLDIQAGQLCRFDPANAETLAAFDMLSRTLRDTSPRNLTSPADALQNAIGTIAADDPVAGAMIKGLIDAAKVDQTPRQPAGD